MEDDDTPDDQAFDLRSYGRRRGRKLSPRQQRLIDELLPKVRLDLALPAEHALRATGLDAARLRQDPSQIARLRQDPSRPAGGEPPPDHPLFEITKNKGFGGHVPQAGAGGSPLAEQPRVWLEIGFGGGEHLVWQARQNPDALFIGCEPFEEGVVKVLTAIEEQAVGNIRLHPDDARDVLRWLPEGAIERAFVLFPDPWPKARHKKRRLVSPATLAMLARVLRPGGELRVATDIGDYARTILAAFQAVPAFRWTAQCAEDWRQRPADWPQTRYEEKAVREGRRSYYLRFERIEEGSA